MISTEHQPPIELRYHIWSMLRRQKLEEELILQEELPEVFERHNATEDERQKLIAITQIFIARHTASIKWIEKNWNLREE